MADKQEANRLIEEYLPLVGHVVNQVAVQFPRHVDLGELTSAGTVGLVEAAYRYEEGRGVPFRHFAGHRIRGAILDFVRKMDWAPRSVREDARRVEKARTEMAGASGGLPSNEALSEVLGISSNELHSIEARASRALLLSLDAPVGDGLGEEFGMSDSLCDNTLVDPSEALEIREMHGYLRDAVAALPPKHSIVVQKTYLEDVPAQEVADELGISVSRISQLRTEALEMLRDGIAAQFTGTDDAEEDAAACRGRVARRKASYAAAIATRSAWRDRLAATAVTDETPARAANYA
ncbi:MAG TPA: sigma-70 family RNA polymerase sigma factor [Acidimicrobiales bacterium]|nr:sigma-70 family RNA polymerase sigma factor [Acidimicrobiales bacterium]